MPPLFTLEVALVDGVLVAELLLQAAAPMAQAVVRTRAARRRTDRSLVIELLALRGTR